MTEFLCDNYIVDRCTPIRTIELFGKFQQYLLENGISCQISQNDFTMKMQHYFCVEKRRCRLKSGNFNCFVGIREKNPTEKQTGIVEPRFGNFSFAVNLSGFERFEQFDTRFFPTGTAGTKSKDLEKPIIKALNSKPLLVEKDGKMLTNPLNYFEGAELLPEEEEAIKNAK